MERKCYVCKEIKDLVLFSRSKNKCMGYSYICKKCTNKKNKEYRLSHLEYFRNYDKNYSRENKEKNNERQRKYNKDPKRKEYMREYHKIHKTNCKTDKIRARVKLNAKIQRGTMIKSPCSICGNIKSEAHHSDYLKPFEVIWLCKEHHTELHNNLKLSTLI